MELCCMLIGQDTQNFKNLTKVSVSGTTVSMLMRTIKSQNRQNSGRGNHKWKVNQTGEVTNNSSWAGAQEFCSHHYPELNFTYGLHTKRDSLINKMITLSWKNVKIRKKGLLEAKLKISSKYVHNMVVEFLVQVSKVVWRTVL